MTLEPSRRPRRLLTELPPSTESDLTRLIRTLVRELKAQVMENVTTAVGLDYDDTPADGLGIVALAKLPSLVLSGPKMVENRFLSTNVLSEEVAAGDSGAEIVRRRPPLTVDLAFTLTGASDRTAELLNLVARVATFLHRNPWLEMLRDESDPAQGTVRWEMTLEGELRSRLEGEEGVRVFTCGLVVRGFDLDEDHRFDVGRAVSETALEVAGLPRKVR